LETLHVAIWPAIVLSYLLFLAGAVWSLGCWFTSDTAIQLNPRIWSRTKRRLAKGKGRNRYWLIKYGVGFAIISLFAVALWATYETNYQIELTRMHGVLIPASDPTPSMCRGAGRNDVVFAFGDHGNGATTNKVPHVLLRSIRLGDVISFDRANDGTIAVIINITDP
jgi:hypothetical protein